MRTAIIKSSGRQVWIEVSGAEFIVADPIHGATAHGPFRLTDPRFRVAPLVAGRDCLCNPAEIAAGREIECLTCSRAVKPPAPQW